MTRQLGRRLPHHAWIDQSTSDRWTCTSCLARQEPRRRCESCGSRLRPPEFSLDVPDRLHSVFVRRALPRLDSDPAERLHVLGVHGGAGESTIAALLPGSVEALGAWPVEPVEDGQAAYSTRVLLVARTHVQGLLAALAALEEWSKGDVFPVRVMGIVMIADARGRMPRKVREMQSLVVSSAPRSWSVPYLSSLRVDEPFANAANARALARLSLEIADAVRERHDAWGPPAGTGTTRLE